MGVASICDNYAIAAAFVNESSKVSRILAD